MLWVTDVIDVFGSMAVYVQLTGDTERLQALRWILTEIPAGESDHLLLRAGEIWGNSDAGSAILYLPTFDPAEPDSAKMLENSADAAASDTATMLESSAGANYVGVAVDGKVELFPVYLPNIFTGLIFSVFPDIRRFVVCGLSPGAGCSIHLRSSPTFQEVNIHCRNVMARYAGYLLKYK